MNKRTIERIHQSVDSLFERLKDRILGARLRDKVIAVTTDRPDLTVAGIAVSAAAGQGARMSRQSLEALVHVAGSYLDAEKERAKAQLVQAVDSTVDPVELGGRLSEVWERVTNNVTRIVDTESQRARSLGGLEGISMLNAQAGVQDPVVFFITVRDQHRCDECTRLHLLPDLVTPRVWRMSELGTGYHKRGDSTPKTCGLHPHCFVGSTRLHTSRGLFPIEDLAGVGPIDVVVDNRVVNRRSPANQYGRDVPGQVWLNRHKRGARILQATEVYDTGVQPCLRITLESGHVLEVSEGHEMWVDDDSMGVKITANRLKVGDKVPLISGEGGFGADSFPVAAELMGNLMGDGSIDQTSGRAQWNFFADDIEYGARLKALASGLVDGPWLDRPLASRPPNEKYAVESAAFNSETLGRQFFEEFSFSKTPRRVPARIWGADRATVAAFLRGLYAADGHVEPAPAVVLGQNDLFFLREIQLLLSMFGLVARIFDHGEEAIKPLSYADGRVFDVKRKPCWRLHLGGWEQSSVFAGEIGFGHNRKQASLLALLTTKPSTLHGAWRTARVASIEPLGSLQTYCLTEEMTNTVTANGIVTGQCRCTPSTLLPGWGFDAAGQVRYISPTHDEFEKQRGLKKSEGGFQPRPHSQDPKYAEWISRNVGNVRWAANGRSLEGSLPSPEGDDMVERCDLAVPLMARDFPELTAKVGEYVHPKWKSGVYHHWLETPQGEIVDPTGAQFDYEGPGSHRAGAYRPHDATPSPSPDGPERLPS